MTKKKTKPVPHLAGTDDIQFTMTFSEEHDDGSATYNIDTNPFTTSKLVEIGVIALLKQHIEQEKVKKPSLWCRVKGWFK